MDYDQRDQSAGSKLFGQYLEFHPPAAQPLATAVSGLAMEVIRRGGELRVIGDGPNQGITVTIGDKTWSLSPTEGPDPEDNTLVNLDQSMINIEREIPGLSDPVDLWMATLRVLNVRESKMRG